MHVAVLLSVVLLSVPHPLGSLDRARQDRNPEQYTRERASMVNRTASAPWHLRCPCPRCDAQSATAPVRSRVRATACVSRSSAAYRPRSDDLAAVYRGPYDRRAWRRSDAQSSGDRQRERLSGSRSRILRARCTASRSCRNWPGEHPRCSTRWVTRTFTFVKAPDTPAGRSTRRSTELSSTAAPEKVPHTLVDQLANEGRLVIPVGDERAVADAHREDDRGGDPSAHDSGSFRAAHTRTVNAGVVAAAARRNVLPDSNCARQQLPSAIEFATDLSWQRPLLTVATATPSGWQVGVG
jgi:hypothetical protein